MTSWTDLEDLGMDDELDDLDPSKPILDSVEPEVIDIDLVSDDDPLEQVWEPAHGYPDSTGTVRVWADDEGNVSRARVSMYWKERVKERGVSLGEMFESALLLVNGRRTPWIPSEIAVEPVPESEAQPLSDELLEQISQERTRLREILEAAEATNEDGLEDQYNGVEVEGYGAGNKVTVTLDIYGGYQSVQFDSTWLDKSRSSQIARAVVEACQAAQRAYQPPTVYRGKRSQIVASQMRLQESLMAAMRRGFK